MGEAGEPAAAAGRGLALAYALINRRERTVAEVHARLERAGVEAAEAAMAVAELLGYGYLDDGRYARVFTQDKRTLEGWGNGRIARALQARGVAGEVIEAALTASDSEAGEAGEAVGTGDREAGGAAGGSSTTDELRRALALLRRRFPGGPAQPADRRRAFGVLARKGYESETAADAVREWARGSA